MRRKDTEEAAFEKWYAKSGYANGKNKYAFKAAWMARAAKEKTQ